MRSPWTTLVLTRQLGRAVSSCGGHRPWNCSNTSARKTIVTRTSCSVLKGPWIRTTARSCLEDSSRAASPAPRTEVPIRRFHHRGGIPVSAVVVACWASCLDLFQRHPFPDHILNAIANNRDHVPILDHVRLVCDAPVTGNHHRAAFLPIFG